MTSSQGSPASPEKMFIAMLALLSCQVSASPIPAKHWAYPPDPQHSRLDFTTAGAANDFFHTFSNFISGKNILSNIPSYAVIGALILLLIIITIGPDRAYSTAKGRWDQSHFVRCILEGLRQARLLSL